MDEGANSPVSAANYIDRTFGEGGFLSRGKADYAPRPGQVAIARAVDRAIEGREHLLAEAATGTGKSIGYAVPATFRVWERKQRGDEESRAVIVTAVISLQEQLAKKDLPLLQAALPWPFTYGVLKGKSNYLCLAKYYKAEGEAWAKVDNFADKKKLNVIQEWARATVKAGRGEESGDVSELPFEDPDLWRRYSVSDGECRGKRCRHHKECFAVAAQDRARRSDVVVTNYHMLFADVLVRRVNPDVEVVPRADVLVLDEAHAAAAIARDFFGWRMTAESARRSARLVQADRPDLEQAVENSSRPFFDLMASLRRDRSRYQGFVDGDFTRHESGAGGRFQRSVADVLEAVRARSGRLRAMAGDGDPASMSTRDRELLEESADLDREAEALERHLACLDQFLNPWAQDGSQVFFLDEDEKGRVSLASKLVHPREVLGPAFFGLSDADDDPLSDLPSTPVGDRAVVVTSATLSTGRGDFSHAARDLGVPGRTASYPGYSSLVVDSPFDWRSNAKLVVPDGMPKPDARDWRDEVVEVLKRTVAACGGRTLGLFTSYAMLNYAHDRLLPFCHDRGIRLLRQKDMPRTKLVEVFREDVSSCLFGTESFWAGVDVPGESLSAVIIDKLPFPTRDDPVIGALSKINRRWFHDLAMPVAVIKWRQGVGRLIRGQRDRGVVVCCDVRLVESGFGKKFLRSIPEMELLSDVADPRVARLLWGGKDDVAPHAQGGR